MSSLWKNQVQLPCQWWWEDHWKICSSLLLKSKMPRKRAVMTDAERAELPSSLFLLSGANPFRRAAVWLSRWIVFEWIIILTIIGKKNLKLTVEWQSRLNFSKSYISMNYAVIRLKLILESFEILNCGLKPLKFQKIEDFK